MLATAPAVFETDRFLGYGVAREGRVTPGDHLQTTWQLWLPGHQLARGEAPWLDPYSFQPVVEPRVNFAGWPFAVVFGPLEALLGTVAGWNAFVLLTYVGAGGFAALWLRSLGLGLGPALVGGLAFALAPYRVAQSTGHLLGPISMLLPLALYGVERRAWLAVAALASIPLSGQVHLALGAIPFVLAYALARRRAWTGVVAAGAGLGTGLLVWALSLRDTVERPYSEVERYSATLLDFVRRDPGEFERFVYLGWLLPVAALVGVACLCLSDTKFSSRPLALVLGLGALVPCLLALGSNLPGYGFIWRNTPLGSTRVPERLLPIACLCLAALAAATVACVYQTQARSRLVAAAALAVVVADLWVPLYDPLNADPDNAVYDRVAHAPPGRLLETPVLPPDDYAGSVYLYYAMQAPRERPLGYATSAPPAAYAAARSLPRAAEKLGVSVVVEFQDGVPVRAVPPAAPAHLVALAPEAVAHCRRSGLLRPICPARVPRVRAPYLRHLSTAAANGHHLFNLERGVPSGVGPPAAAHLTFLAGDIDRADPAAYPGRSAALDDALLATKRTTRIDLGPRRWRDVSGRLSLAPPFPHGGVHGDHLVFRWRERGHEYAVSLHAWTPVAEAEATLRAVIESAR